MSTVPVRDRWYSSVGAVSDAVVKKYLNDLKVPVPPATRWVASGLYGPAASRVDSLNTAEPSVG